MYIVEIKIQIINYVAIGFTMVLNHLNEEKIKEEFLDHLNMKIKLNEEKDLQLDIFIIICFVV